LKAASPAVSRFDAKSHVNVASMYLALRTGVLLLWARLLSYFLLIVVPPYSYSIMGIQRRRIAVITAYAEM